MAFEQPLVQVGDSVWFWVNNKAESPKAAIVVGVGTQALNLAVWLNAAWYPKDSVRHCDDPIFNAKGGEYQRANGMWDVRVKTELSAESAPNSTVKQPEKPVEKVQQQARTEPSLTKSESDFVKEIFGDKKVKQTA